MIPLDDVNGNDGTAPPAQMVSVVPNAKEGTMLGLTVRSNVAGNAHNPAVGVKVYVPDTRLLAMAGDHVPVILLEEVLGNAGAAVPAQIVIAVPKLNVGIIFGVTVTVKVEVVAHWFAAGVNV